MLYPTSEYVKNQCLKQCQGSYQRDLVDGFYRWSGSDIQNKWGARYMESRCALWRRLEEDGLITIETMVAGKCYLIVGTSLDECETVTQQELLDYWV